MTSDDDDLMSGIRGMRKVLSRALAALCAAEMERPVAAHEWAGLAAQYATLADLEQRRADAAMVYSTEPCEDEDEDEDDDEPTWEYAPWVQYTPGRVVTDGEGDRFYVVGYLHNKEPLLSLVRSYDGVPFSVPSMEMRVQPLSAVINRHFPVTLTDEYVK